MNFSAPLIAVQDMEVSKKFYQEILQQRIILDFGENVTFTGNFALQSDFAKLVDFDEQKMKQGSHNFELYFEEENLDNFISHLETHPEVKYLHKVKEYPWGQRVIRFYDPDMHIIEVGESMECVIKRCLKQGLSIEETVEKTMHPLELVKKYAADLN
jgi:catechol 2,3-dioxygenase-like lactoylglutathione lyase family enzyme